MRLRCPKQGCLINVPDELLGTTIRCPLCTSLIVVDARDRDISAAQFKPGDPAVTPESEAAKKEALDPENRIYDGLPPLSLMIALRKRKGANYDASDFAPRYEMTEDDWKALDAFESVLYAVGSLRISTVVGAFVLFINFVQVSLLYDTQARNAQSVHPAMNLLMLGCLGVCLVAQFLGASALARVRMSWSYELLIPALVLSLLLFCGSITLNGLLFWKGQSPEAGFAGLVGLIFNSIALLDLTGSLLRARAAAQRLAPSEISHRLSEALRYLE